MKHLRPGEKVEADNGCRGEPKKIKTPNNFYNEAEKRAKQKVRSRHETVNKRFKDWQCLKRVFRHDISKHDSVFAAVAVITQLAIEKGGEPLFGVNYNFTY